MLSVLRKQWFLVGLAIAIAIAIAAPDVGRRGGPLAPEKWQPLLVAAIFFSSGLGLGGDQLWSAARDIRLHLFVQGISLVVAPLLFFIAARLLSSTSVPLPILEGVVVLGCLPTTVTSGVAFTRASGGDEAGALFNATLGSMLGVVVTPFTVLVATGHHATVPFPAVLTDLAWQVVAPVLLGQALRFARPKWVASVKPWLGTAGIVLLLVLIYFVFAGSLARGFAASPTDVLAAILICIALHAALIFVALETSRLSLWRFSKPKRTAAVIGSTQKTAALGLPLLAILFHDDPTIGLLALPLLIYHPLQLAVAGALVGAWRRYNDVDTPLDPTT